MNDVIRFAACVLLVEVGVFSGVLLSEYLAYRCGRKETLFHENWRTIFR